MGHFCFFYMLSALVSYCSKFYVHVAGCCNVEKINMQSKWHSRAHLTLSGKAKLEKQRERNEKQSRKCCNVTHVNFILDSRHFCSSQNKMRGEKELFHWKDCSLQEIFLESTVLQLPTLWLFTHYGYLNPACLMDSVDQSVLVVCIAIHHLAAILPGPFSKKWRASGGNYAKIYNRKHSHNSIFWHIKQQN